MPTGMLPDLQSRYLHSQAEIVWFHCSDPVWRGPCNAGSVACRPNGHEKRKMRQALKQMLHQPLLGGP